MMSKHRPGHLPASWMKPAVQWGAGDPNQNPRSSVNSHHSKCSRVEERGTVGTNKLWGLTWVGRTGKHL